MKILKLLFLFFFVLSFNVMYATTFNAGEIGIIGYNYDDPDELKIVVLVDVTSGTTISITDNGWTGTALSTTEGTYTYTFASAVSKGTVISISPTAVAFSTSGDQIFIYQGTAASPTFITGISTTPFITTGAISSTTSYKPAALTAGTNCIAFSTEKDDGKYNVVTNSGSASSIAASIYTLTNWTNTDTRITSWTAWTFSLNSFATEPTASPTALTSLNVKSYKFDVKYTAASPAANGYLVLWKKGSSPSSSPTDGLTYSVGDAIGDAKVGYIGAGNTYTQKGSIEAGTTYYYKIFSYNGSASTINYKTTAPLAGSITSLRNMMGSYYSGCNTASNKFLDSLQAKIRRNTTKISYTNYTTTMIADFAYRDTAAGQRVVSCVYSGDKYVYTTFAWYTTGTFSREHTWCHSWMPTYSSTSGAEYSDQHHLFPTEQAHANGVRSNHPEGVVTTVTSTYLNAKIGTNANGKVVYEPQNNHKGNTARALLYMAVRYNGVSGYDWTFNYLNKTTLVALTEDSQSVATLLAWHAADPVDSYEVARNDYVYSIQGNRNPFVDHPEYVNYINFHNVTYSTTGSNKTGNDDQANGLESAVNNPFKMYAMPNPFNGELIISMNANEDMKTQLHIYDITGKLVEQKPIYISCGFNAYTYNTENWPSGIYIVKIIGNGQVIKVIKD